MPKVTIAGASNAHGQDPDAPAYPELEPAGTEEPAGSEVVPDPGPSPDLTLLADSPVSSVHVEDYSSYPILKLREFARERGLPVAGPKAELVERLAEDDRAAG